MEGLKLKPTLTKRIEKRGYKPITMYASSASYTGNGGTETSVVFQCEEDAMIDCEIQFKNSVAEAEVNGDMASNSGWNKDTACGVIDWIDGERSTFEVKTVDYFSNKQVTETLVAEQDWYKLQCDMLKEAIIKAGPAAIEDFFGFEFSGLEDTPEFEVEYDNILAQMPDDVFDTYYKEYVLNEQINKLIATFFNTQNVAAINRVLAVINIEFSGRLQEEEGFVEWENLENDLKRAFDEMDPEDVGSLYHSYVIEGGFNDPKKLEQVILKEYHNDDIEYSLDFFRGKTVRMSGDDLLSVHKKLLWTINNDELVTVRDFCIEYGPFDPVVKGKLCSPMHGKAQSFGFPKIVEGDAYTLITSMMEDLASEDKKEARLFRLTDCEITAQPNYHLVYAIMLETIF